MGKNVEFGLEARGTMQRGIDILANAVKATLGPRGRHVAIEMPYGPPLITKDGVTVARSIDLNNRLENMGAQLVRAVASAANSAAGDGTTTATVLTQAIYNEGSKMVVAGNNPVLIKRGIDLASEAAVSKLKEIAVEVKDHSTIEHVATISANNDRTLGTLIAEAIAAVGEHGVVAVEEAPGAKTQVTYTEGLKIDRGLMSLALITNPYKDACHKERKPLLLIVRDMEENILSVLIRNRLENGLACAVIKAPGYGDHRRDMLDDIAVMCGGKLFTDESGIGISEATTADLGKVRKVSAAQNETSLIDCGGDVTQRVEEIKAQLQVENLYDMQERHLRERLAKLSGGVAILRVGGASDSEVKEKKARVEDSINAVRAAIEEGIVPGGGAALLHCLSALESIKTELPEEEIGVKIVHDAMQAPFKQIMDNAGFNHFEFQQKIMKAKGFSGFDALHGVFIKDMLSHGITDPVKVVRTALEKAASAGGILLTTEVSIFSAEEQAE
jgi:chaperonin GroEL